MRADTKQALDAVKSLAELVREAKEAATPNLVVGRPEGGITIKEYERETGVGPTAARGALEKLAERGEYEIIDAVAPLSYSPTRIMRQRFYRKVNR